LSHLAGGQLEVGVIALLGEELSERASAPTELPALTRLELHVVHEGAEGNVPDRQRITRENVGLRSRHDRVPRFEAEGSNDVALLAVPVVQERDARRAVRVVFDAGDHGRNTQLLAPEVDRPQHAAGAATPMTHGDPARGVSPTPSALRRKQALLR